MAREKGTKAVIIGISMLPAVKEEINRVRGSVSFSAQIVNDLTAYWEAVRAGMQSLKRKIFRHEAVYLAMTIRKRDWASMKLSTALLEDIVEVVEEGPSAGANVDLPHLVGKLQGLTLLELMALVNWARNTEQLGETPEAAAAVFPQG